MTDFIPQPVYPPVLDPVTGLKLCAQDSVEDIRGTALAALRTPIGHHDSLPDLGTPDLVGTTLTAEDLEQVARGVVTRYDDRAEVLVDAETTDMLATVNLEVLHGE